MGHIYKDAFVFLLQTVVGNLKEDQRNDINKHNPLINMYQHSDHMITVGSTNMYLSLACLAHDLASVPCFK